MPSALPDWSHFGLLPDAHRLEQYPENLPSIQLLRNMDWRNACRFRSCGLPGRLRLPYRPIRLVHIPPFSKKPLFSNELLDKSASLTLKAFIGYVLTGVGFGLGGMLFDSFLLTVPSSEIRLAVFWGVPCIFSMKAVQVLSSKS
jgi:hypothetical protein